MKNENLAEAVISLNHSGWLEPSPPLSSGCRRLGLVCTTFPQSPQQRENQQNHLARPGASAFTSMYVPNMYGALSAARRVRILSLRAAPLFQARTADAVDFLKEG